jgi:7-carboxy-7-deazaguanine synthase
VSVPSDVETSSADLLRLSEVFDSLQGEGPNTGKPCRFVRLALCNLRCRYCDTKYTWDFEHHDYEREVKEATLESVVEAIAAAPQRHVVITGGEPLLQQRALERVLREVPASIFIEVETNGTRVPRPSLAQRIDQWNVSPKLSSAGDDEAQRIKPEALEALRATGRAYLKLVIKSESDKVEAEALRVRFGFDRERTLLMPEAASAEELRARAPVVAAWAQQLGLRFSDRLHVALWGGRRGT